MNECICDMSKDIIRFCILIVFAAREDFV